MAQTTSNTRWIQLLLGLIVMMAISSPQYVWTLFTKPFQTTTGAALPAIQITFSLLIVLQTFFSPVQGWLIDRFGPKLLIADRRALLSGLGWVLSAYATSLTALYLTYGLFCGIGTGIVYIGIVGLMVRWFPDRRGFAAGVVAAGYGFGAILTTFPIDTHDQELAAISTTLIVFGIILGVVGVAAALGLRVPPPGEVAEPPPSHGRRARQRDTRPQEMLKTPMFWLMFVMMTMMSTGGLMVISQVRGVRPRIRRRRRHRVRPGGAAAGADRRSHHQRPDAAVLRLGVGPHRSREHDGHRLRARRRAPSRCCSVTATNAVRVRRCCRAWCSSAGARSSRCSPRR